VIARGYRIYKPSSPNDILIKELVEGIDYSNDALNIIWNENSNLTSGIIEHRYIVAFDDDIEGYPSPIFDIFNLTSPNNITTIPNDFNKVTLNFINVEYAESYYISVMKVSDYVTREETLSLNKTIINLEENTQYSIKVKSVNPVGETTFSDPIFVTTLRVLNLLGIANNTNSVTWYWSNLIASTNTDHFELYDSSETFIANTGLNTSFTEINLPVKIREVYLKEVNKNYSFRTSNLVQIPVYNDGKLASNVHQSVSTEYSIKNAVSVHYDTRNLQNQFIAKIITYRKYIEQLNAKSLSYTKNLNSSDIKIRVFNNLKDYRIVKDNYYSKNLKDNFYTKQIISNSNKSGHVFNIKLITNEKLTINYKIMIRRDISQVLNIKPSISTSGNIKFGSKVLVFKKSILTSNYKMIISNSYENKYIYTSKINNSFDDTLTYLRFITHNPAIPFDIKTSDIIWNTIFKDIKLLSNINKMRILCVGDSITAGAPNYDPKYGGTVYMADLVTGKVITKNNKESQYPYWLQTRLGTDDYEVINEGTGRQITDQVRYGIDSLMKLYRPQFVIVLIGTNDLFSAQDKSQDEINNVVQHAINNIIETAEIIKSYGAKPIIGTNLPRNSIVPSRAKDGLRALNAGIKQYGIINALDIIDWYDLFVIKDHKIIDGEDIYTETGVLRYDLSGDDTHPNIEGYKEMAQVINLSTFNSFRAVFRIFRSLKIGIKDVDYNTEESKTQPNPYEINYIMTLPKNMKRLQKYSITRYIKNTGNSWGMYIIEIAEQEDIVKIWDERTNSWGKTITGQLAPSDIKELKTKFTMPSVGRIKEVNLKITFIEFRR